MTCAERAMEAAGCKTRRCLLSQEHNALTRRMRFTHNGISFSRSFDLDDIFACQIGEDDVLRLVALWCQEHHAGRDGTSIRIVQPDGLVQTLLVPEAVD